MLQAQGRPAEAVECHDQAIRLAPGLAEPHLNRAMAWLQMGDFAQGWNEYEWRWRCRASGIRSFHQPVWSGAPLEGRTILLHTEQGLGDAIQFIRYARLVKRHGGHVLVACQQPLARLMESCTGVDMVIEEGKSLPPFDCHAPLLSLPRIFETTLETVPAEIPYLAADPVLINQWRVDLVRFPLGLRTRESFCQSTPPTPPSQGGEEESGSRFPFPPLRRGGQGGWSGVCRAPENRANPHRWIQDRGCLAGKSRAQERPLAVLSPGRAGTSGKSFRSAPFQPSKGIRRRAARGRLMLLSDRRAWLPSGRSHGYSRGDRGSRSGYHG